MQLRFQQQLKLSARFTKLPNLQGWDPSYFSYTAQPWHRACDRRNRNLAHAQVTCHVYQTTGLPTNTYSGSGQASCASHRSYWLPAASCKSGLDPALVACASTHVFACLGYLKKDMKHQRLWTCWAFLPLSLCRGREVNQAKIIDTYINTIVYMYTPNHGIHNDNNNSNNDHSNNSNDIQGSHDWRLAED